VGGWEDGEDKLSSFAIVAGRSPTFSARVGEEVGIFLAEAVSRGKLVSGRVWLKAGAQPTEQGSFTLASEALRKVPAQASKNPNTASPKIFFIFSRWYCHS
jgi:hypothetical protein